MVLTIQYGPFTIQPSPTRLFVAVKSLSVDELPHPIISHTSVALNYLEISETMEPFVALGPLPVFFPLPRMPSLLSLIETRL